MKTLKNTLIIRTASVPMKMAMLMLIIASTLFSCKDTDLEKISNSGGKAPVAVHIEETSYEDVGTIANKKAAIGGALHPTEGIQKATVPFNKDFNLIAELSVAKPSPQVSNSQGKRAAIETNPMKAGVKYKIIVFDHTEKYVAEQDYARGQESGVLPFLLDGDKEYTFVVYSINNDSPLPQVTFADNSNKTLRNSSITIDGNMDFLYAKQKKTVIGGITNQVNVSLKHRFSQITTIVDASKTGYEITAITSTIGGHNPKATINLFDGAITRTGTVTGSAVVFPALSSQIVTSTPTIINADVSNSSYNIGSITVGPLTKTNITPFTDLIIKPGVKYNMTLTLTPADGYLDYKSHQAVRINGIIWMRLNEGVSTNLNPDITTPYTSSYHGNYYQWGRFEEVANGSSINVNTNWDGVNRPDDDAWNWGDKYNPVKSINDPCPMGYRVPTEDEYNELFANTSPSSRGDWRESSTNYTAAKVLTSKNNKNIKIIFPAQGYFSADGPVSGNPPYTALPIQLRGSAGGYLTSSASRWGLVRAIFFENEHYVNEAPGNHNGRKYSALSLRCVAEFSN